MNIERLRRIKEHILEEPLRVNMSTLLHSQDTTVRAALPRCLQCIAELPMSSHQWPACKTIACIAGWENLLFGLHNKQNRTLGAPGAQIRLDLPNDFLFFPQYWPGYLYSLLREHPPGSLPYAQVVAEAIESYISTNGWQDVPC